MSVDTARRTDFADIRVGDLLPKRTWTVSKADIESFGDFLYPATPDNPKRLGNPHMDEEYARKHIYGGLFVDGNQTVACLCQLATDWLPPGALVSGFSDVDIKLPNPIRVADVVTFSGEVASTTSREGRDYVTLQVLARNQAGKVVAAGTIATCVPRAGSESGTRSGVFARQ